MLIFTTSTTGSIQSLSFDVRESPVCVFVCANAETQLPGRLRLLVEERIAYIGITLDILVFVVFAFLMIFFIFGLC